MKLNLLIFLLVYIIICMEEERPNLTVINGGVSERDNKHTVKPTTGLTEGQPSKIIDGERPSFITRVRRVLSDVVKKLDTNPQNKPPIGRAL